jgi:hypothetical protein
MPGARSADNLSAVVLGRCPIQSCQAPPVPQAVYTGAFAGVIESTAEAASRATLPALYDTTSRAPAAALTVLMADGLSASLRNSTGKGTTQNLFGCLCAGISAALLNPLPETTFMTVLHTRTTRPDRPTQT